MKKRFRPEDIRQLRTSRKWSPGQLAKFLRVTVDSVHKWERGDRVPTPPVMMLMDLMEAGKI